jgi:hypothetical protein
MTLYTKIVKFVIKPVRVDGTKFENEFVFSCDAVFVVSSSNDGTRDFDVADGT